MSGEYTCRDHRDDKGDRPPMKPIELAKQREAIRLLQDEILSDKAFQFKPELLRHLAPDHWRDTGFWFFEPYQYPVLQYVSSLQRFVVSQLLNPRIAAVLAGSLAPCRAGQDAGNAGDLRRPDRFDLEGAAIGQAGADAPKTKVADFHDPAESPAGARRSADSDRLGAEAEQCSASAT